MCTSSKVLHSHYYAVRQVHPCARVTNGVLLWLLSYIFGAKIEITARLRRDSVTTNGIVSVPVVAYPLSLVEVS